MALSSTPAGRVRRPRGSLTPAAILDAAEAVAQAGFDALTWRAVAAHLHAAPMALYHYFPTKDALVDALLDRVLGRFVAPPPAADWLVELQEFAQRHRQLLDAHPWAIAALFAHPTPGPEATRIGEIALDILARGGLDPPRGVAIFSGLIAVNYGWAAFTAGRHTVAGPGAAQVAASLAALPRARFPRTAAAASELARYGSPRHYEVVLETLLAGLRAG
jgi:AcrR family transcriptional regulator